MMRFTKTTLTFLLATAAKTQAFTTTNAPPSRMVTTPLFTSETHINPDFTSGSGMDVDSIPVFIKNLSKDNFDESLEMMEPLLQNEVVGKEYDDFMDQLKQKCKEIGMELPKNYAPTHH